jgi:tetratricopeptide (TPR) repeat protein
MMRSALALCLVATAAYAGPLDEAKSHFKQGKAYQEAGAFLRAAEEFEAAYALDPRTEMLFNIAQAYRLGSDKPKAVDYFQRYLAAQPDGKAADEAATAQMKPRSSRPIAPRTLGLGLPRALSATYRR